MTQILAQDPDELFDVVTPAGVPTGVRKRRADVHRHGDWHAAVHMWVVRVSGDQPQIIFQRRSVAKDTFGGKLDATVGGHLNAGEIWRDALRESVEEIGVAWTEADLHSLGLRIAVGERLPESADREVQFVFMVRDDRPLAAYEPNPVELAGLVALPLDGALDMFGGYIDGCPAEALDVGQTVAYETRVTIEDFPEVQDRYYYRVAIAARSFLNGERHFSV
jgi:isopentenyldiphosphate isomerase